MAFDPKNIALELNSGKVKPVYLLKGEEHFLHQFLTKKIETVLKKKDSVEKRVFIPEELKKERLMDVLNTSDLFSSRKLIILFSPQKLKGRIQDDILFYCKKPNPNHTLIMINEDFYSKSKFLSKLEKIIPPLDLRTPFDSELKKWTRVLLKEHNKTATSEAVSLLVNLFGDSIYHIANEIDKICINYKGAGPITINNIENNVNWQKSYQNWEFLDVIARKKLSDALFRGHSYLKSVPDFMVIMNIFITFFTSLYFLKISGGTFLGSVGSIPLSPYIKKRLPIGAKYYSKNELEKIIQYLTILDRRLKTSSISHESAFTKFLFYAIG